MSKNYKVIAEQILPLVGGKENVRNCYHCQTRLRFTLADESKADKAALEALDAVRKVMINAGVYQVVIGTDVADLFAELEPMLDLKPDSVAPAEKKGVVNTIIDFIAGTFQPIIPALSGAGMLRALMAILVAFHLVDTSSQTYAILNFFGDAVFYFLPLLLAFSQAQKLKCNPVLAAAVAGIMMHPTWNAMVAAGESVSFFGILPFTLVSYTGTVIPIILVIFVQSFIEKKLNKWIPKSVNLVFVPMLTFLVMGALALSILGPIGNIVGQGLSVVFNFLSTNASWAPAVLIGGLYAGITHTHRFATGSSGQPAVFLYIGDNTMTYFYNIIIALVITSVVTAIVIFVLSLRFERTEAAVHVVTSIVSKPGVVCAPVCGDMVAMTEIPDETFATGVLGEG